MAENVYSELVEPILYYGDNLEILRRYIKNESVGLVHLDPPFNSNRNYEAFCGETKEKRSFEDRYTSHYVKIMLDQIFSENNFQNEIIWKRTSAHNDPNKYGTINDSIFFYTKTTEYIWNPQYQSYDEEYIETFFDEKNSDGRPYKRMDLTGAGKTNGESG